MIYTCNSGESGIPAIPKIWLNSSFTINIKAARDFCPDVICRHLNVYCNCGLLSIALGSEDTYVDFSK